MTYTLESDAIVRAIEDTTRNVIVGARAGTGKTTNIRRVIRTIKEFNPGATIRYLVYTKRNEEEFQQYSEAKLDGVSAKTINATGHEVSRYNIRFVNTKAGYKTKAVIEELMLDHNVPAKDAEMLSFKYMHAYEGAFGLLKNSLIHSQDDYTDEASDKLVEYYDFEIPFIDIFEKYNIDADKFFWKAYDNSQLTPLFDFTDQFYRPLRFGWLPQEKFDYVLIDECQDLSLAKTEFIRTLGHRFLFVGDDLQTIFGFAGSYPDNMQYVKDSFDCLEFPLTINWRCSRAVIAAAHIYSPELTACPTANDGLVGTITREQFIEEATSGDLVLCRTNAPCLEYAIGLMSVGKRVGIYGRDFADGMKRAFEEISRNMSSKSLTNFELATVKYFQTRLAKVRSRKMRMEVEDQLAAFLALVKSQPDYYSIQQLLNTLFKGEGDSQAARQLHINLSSIHRAKGLEFNNVFLIKPNLLPHPYIAKTNAFQIQQETNLAYVALTRSKNNYFTVVE